MRAALARVIPFVLRSNVRIWSAVVGATVLSGVLEFAVVRWFIGLNLTPNLCAALQACVVGLGTGILLFFVLLGIIERRRIVADHLRRVAALNLSVRNALELIMLAHYAEEDHDHKAMVLECTHRIDRTLREVFPAIEKSGTHRRTGGSHVVNSSALNDRDHY